MQCHYTVLGVQPDANRSEIQAAYYKLTVKWDSDQIWGQEETDEFKAIHEAFAVLNNEQQKSWYDSHREEILNGIKNPSDTCVDVASYISPECFVGFGDDQHSFYTVFRELFKKIADEDYLYMSSSEPKIPGFGDSHSDFSGTVETFYSYWTSYCTKKSYSWVDTHDVRLAVNRRQLNVFEEENKKLRNLARDERNMDVRSLVSFVKRNDKRVEGHASTLEALTRMGTQDGEINIMGSREQSLENLNETTRFRYPTGKRNLEHVRKIRVKDGRGNTVGFLNNLPPEAYRRVTCAFCKYVLPHTLLKMHEKSSVHIENVKKFIEKIKRTQEQQHMDNIDGDKSETSQNETEKESQTRMKKKLKKKRFFHALYRGTTHKINNSSDESEDEMYYPIRQVERNRKKSEQNKKRRACLRNARKLRTQAIFRVNQTRVNGKFVGVGPSYFGIIQRATMPSVSRMIRCIEKKVSKIDPKMEIELYESSYENRLDEKTKATPDDDTSNESDSSENIACNFCGSKFETETLLFNHLQVCNKPKK